MAETDEQTLRVHELFKGNPLGVIVIRANGSV